MTDEFDVKNDSADLTKGSFFLLAVFISPSTTLIYSPSFTSLFESSSVAAFFRKRDSKPAQPVKPVKIYIEVGPSI
jgi:hypothetical protein